jgi:glycopeptide antibiotics resistance protein
MRKILAKGLLASYILVLIWLVLFKFTFHISKILHHNHRSLNLVPFGAPSMVNGRIDYMEMVFNCLFFIPFGLLLSVNFKRAGFVPKLAFIMVFSISAELIQYIFAIGASDITDVITNTAGGFLGLIIYGLSNKFINTEKLDRIVITVGIVLLAIFLSIHGLHFLRASHHGVQ